MEDAPELPATPKIPNFSHIKNKHKRQELYNDAKKQKRKAQLQTRMQRRKIELAHPELKAERLAKNVPRTVENSKTWVGMDEDGNVIDKMTAPVQLDASAGDDPANFKLDMAGLEELFPDEEQMHYQAQQQEQGPEASTSDAQQQPQQPPLPQSNRVLITTTPKPSKQLMIFLDEMQSLLGGKRHADIVPRKNSRFQISKVSNWAAKRGYGALLVVGEDHKEPSSLTLSKLPYGPTSHFRLTSAQLSKEISGHAAPTPHAPELVLSNMSTPLGLSVGRLLQSLFPPLPQLQGRQVVAVHNQRDFIFFRRFRYMFSLRESEAGMARAKATGMDEQVRAKMQEIGPRLTLKLRWIKKGTLASGRLKANGNLIGDDLSAKQGQEQQQAHDEHVEGAEGKSENEGGSDSDSDGEAVIEDDAAAQLEQDVTLPEQNEHDIPAPAAAEAEPSQAPALTEEEALAKKAEKKRKRASSKAARVDIKIPKSQYGPTAREDVYQHRIKKPKKGGSVLDGLNLQGGTADKQKTWAWKPKMQHKKNRFFL